jgi:hypothetical protein
MPLRTCAVTFTDARGVKHTAEVTAETLFEAAILGLQIFEEGWLGRGHRGSRHEDRDRGARARDEAHYHPDANRTLVERGDDQSERAGEEGSAEGDALGRWSLITSAAITGRSCSARSQLALV